MGTIKSKMSTIKSKMGTLKAKWVQILSTKEKQNRKGKSKFCQGLGSSLISLN